MDLRNIQGTQVYEEGRCMGKAGVWGSHMGRKEQTLLKNSILLFLNLLSFVLSTQNPLLVSPPNVVQWYQ